MNTIDLFPHQKEAIDKLDSGSILCGGVGSGKSITALAFFYFRECGGGLGRDGKLSKPKSPRDVYIITTARKRDTHEWEEECSRFGLSTDREQSVSKVKVTIDSWNNIHKYESMPPGSFYIFDEQRVVGSGSWVKSFVKIAKRNRWILLSATPGDTWMDYIPVFVANGFYKNRTEFLTRHAVYNRFARYPKVDRFVECGRLEMLRRKITVTMEYTKKTVPHFINIPAEYDPMLFNQVAVSRWNPFDNEPIKDISESCYLMRRVVNSDPSKLSAVNRLMLIHPRIIIFYNFNYELDMLRGLSEKRQIAEWNGHLHEPIPDSDKWLYLVQYIAGAEGWNCISTDVVIFFSQNYSYKLMTQAAGRIDRLNTPYTDLYYYNIKSKSPIDQAIAKALRNKKSFNEETFLESFSRVENTSYYEREENMTFKTSF